MSITKMLAVLFEEDVKFCAYWVGLSLSPLSPCLSFSYCNRRQEEMFTDMQ